MRACIHRLLGIWEGPGRGVARLLARFLPRPRERIFYVEGHRVAAQTLDRMGVLSLWKAGLLDHGEALLMQRRVGPGMVALDIGANIGFYTLLLAQRIGPGGRVIAFEPEPENYGLLVRNISMNGYSNVECVQKAVSNKTGQARLFYCEEHRGDHRIFDSQDGRPSFFVESIRLDDWLPSPANADFVKLDIQGAEMLALEGMQSLLERCPWIGVLCEFSPNLLKIGGSGPEEFLHFWKSRGFRGYLVEDKKELRRLPDAPRLIRLCRGAGYLNLFFSRN